MIDILEEKISYFEKYNIDMSAVSGSMMTLPTYLAPSCTKVFIPVAFVIFSIESPKPFDLFDSI